MSNEPSPQRLDSNALSKERARLKFLERARKYDRNTAIERNREIKKLICAAIAKAKETQ